MPSSSEAVVQSVVTQEAQRGEHVLSWVRAVSVSLFALQGMTVGRDDPVLRQVSDPLLFVGLAACGVLWLMVYLSRPSRYHPALSYVSAALDVLLVTAASLQIGLFGGALGATATLIAATPIYPLLLFLVAASAVRQSMAVSLTTGAVAVVLYSAVLVAIAPLGDASTLTPENYQYAASPALWGPRFMALVFTAIIAGLGARSARRMARQAGEEIASRQRVVSVFGRYVDPAVAAGALTAEGAPAEMREVTVIFTDLRGFTTLSETLPPRELLDLLNEHYAAVVPVVHNHGGAVNKFVGDAVMAVFGAPLHHSDHAARAVRAARDMVAAMEVLNEKLKTQGRPTLAMGVGISTGPVVVGSLGTDERLEYAVIGDTVNTASRLEGMNKEMGTQILLSVATRDALGDDTQLKALGEVTLKGKARPVAVYTTT